MRDFFCVMLKRKQQHIYRLGGDRPWQNHICVQGFSELKWRIRTCASRRPRANSSNGRCRLNQDSNTIFSINQKINNIEKASGCEALFFYY